MSDVSCAIIGGGIAGASVAYHLSERGVDDVVLLERNADLISETTPKSFALFGMYGDKNQYQLKRYAMGLYNQFASEDENIRFERIGHLSLATTEEVDQGFEQAVTENTDDLGIFATASSRTSLEYFPGTEIHESVFAPTLRTEDVEGALYRPAIGYFDPVALTRALLDRATRNGVDIQRNATVEEVSIKDGRVTGLSVDGTDLTVDEVVLAAGPWTADLAETAEASLPLRHSLAPVLVLDAAGQPQTTPSVKHHESKFNIRGHAADDTIYLGHHQGGYESGTRMNPDDVPSSVPESVRSNGFDVLKRLFPDLADASVVDEWVGVRSLTPDGNPIVGPTAVAGLSVVAFNSSGIQLAPGLGRLIASQVVDNTRTPLHEALSLDRFEGYSTVQ